jgi:hypothetical protein
MNADWQRTEPDIEALDATLAAIEADPDSWYQADWRCGTGMCFAGHAAVLKGASFPYPEDDERGDLVDPPGYGQEERLRIAEFAQLSLGLDDYQAARLFRPENELSDLRDVVARIKAGEDFSADYGTDDPWA